MCSGATILSLMLAPLIGTRASAGAGSRFVQLAHPLCYKAKPSPSPIVPGTCVAAGSRCVRAWASRCAPCSESWPEGMGGGSASEGEGGIALRTMLRHSLR